ncbi:glycerol acyltransferase [Elizabethkingia anophelis]|uniref:Glycerol acyltransferase n=1 Tax=Elizabethkingia anophelis TaxID=1117645 RepID=A0AAE4T6G0_9FLAO|nr:glycerol acyltransferase [Elizabethkingia anophelis]MCT3952929.1 glycerol acyltransferase [Elizabethkingia anophelis]MCT3956470.1 glycerol acyltransferase [Elizabethkingia anophelis]MCT3988160.1 glycerol acyltransferase [Elizabethkingia anophelis]MCT4066597.1 glycerol acyltransferase [Elizabethkingia anophelis]
MKKFIGSTLLKLLGWKVKLDGDLKNLDRCILVEAPHTSNWDYLLGIMVYWKYGKCLKVIIKDSHTKAFYGGIIKSIGAIGIDRSQKNDLINVIAREFEKDDFSLVITPEGSRSYAKKWKLGFYHMALQAKVPIVLASGDYKYKEIKIGHMISYEDLTTRSFESVMDEIENYFKDINAKYPENYNPKIY